MLHCSLPLLILFSWTPVRLRLGVHLRSLPGLIRPLHRSFVHLRSGERRASPVPVCVQPLLHQCVLITLHELARATQASHPGVGPYRAPASAAELSHSLPVPRITAVWPHLRLRLFSSEHPRNSSALSYEFVVPLLVRGLPLNSRASKQSRSERNNDAPVRS